MASAYWMRSLVPIDRKSALLGEQVGHHHRRRHLDHDPDRHLGVERRALAHQLGLGLVEHLLGLAQLADARDHREHDAHAPVHRRAQEAAQLRLEQLALAQAEADRAQPERRVGLVAERGERHHLVAAEIEGAEGRGERMQPLEHAARVQEVLLLLRQIGAIEEEELGAVEADALGAVLERARHLLGELDVGVEPHARAVGGLGRQVAVLEQLVHERLVPLRAHAVLVDLLRRRAG